jgi:formylglycine-generating enzyme required for sulfatase activity
MCLRLRSWREVTQDQYEAVIGSNPSEYLFCGDCPVEGVTWNEETAFCQAIGGRLPSEAEWEYAARAGTTTKYYCGDSSSCLDGIAWHMEAGMRTHPVAMKTANAFGLYDMLGNVWERVDDCFNSSYTGAPSNGDTWSSGDCSQRGYRGGSWNYFAYHTDSRVSDRDWASLDYVQGYYGFRCARECACHETTECCDGCGPINEGQPCDAGGGESSGVCNIGACVQN